MLEGSPGRAPHYQRGRGQAPPFNQLEYMMAWTKPEFVDFRFGFEITMYVMTR
jgi:coenzyme PQQ precursor peptide PqqA